MPGYDDARRVRQRLHDAAGGRGHDRQHALVGDVPARPRPGRAARAWPPRPTPPSATTGSPQHAEAVDRMRFAEAVFREAARLKSTAPLLFFEPQRRHHGGRRRAARRARAIVASRARSAGPQHPERFDPDRWLTDGADPEDLPLLRRRPALLPGPQPRLPGGQDGAGDARPQLRVGARGRRAARALRLHDAPDGPAGDAAPAPVRCPPSKP